MQEKKYGEQAKNPSLPIETVVIMNEERRRQENLPPMTEIDYNCIDRAALKLKYIIDCLFPVRKVNGISLEPRNIKEALLLKEERLRKDKQMKIASKNEDFSPLLVIAIGAGIDAQGGKLDYNPKAIRAQVSALKLEQYR